MNILITAASTAQAYQLERFLDSGGTIFFADSVELPQVMLKDKQFVKIPKPENPSFAHLLLTVCLDRQIEKLFPLRRLEVLALAEARQLFDEYGIEVVVPLQPAESFWQKKPSKGELILLSNPLAQHSRGIFVRNDGDEVRVLFTVD